MVSKVLHDYTAPQVMEGLPAAEYTTAKFWGEFFDRLLVTEFGWEKLDSDGGTHERLYRPTGAAGTGFSYAFVTEARVNQWMGRQYIPITSASGAGRACIIVPVAPGVTQLAQLQGGVAGNVQPPAGDGNSWMFIGGMGQAETYYRSSERLARPGAWRWTAVGNESFCFLQIAAAPVSQASYRPQWLPGAGLNMLMGDLQSAVPGGPRYACLAPARHDVPQMGYVMYDPTSSNASYAHMSLGFPSSSHYNAQWGVLLRAGEWHHTVVVPWRGARPGDAMTNPPDGANFFSPILLCNRHSAIVARIPGVYSSFFQGSYERDTVIENIPGLPGVRLQRIMDCRKDEQTATALWADIGLNW